MGTGKKERPAGIGITALIASFSRRSAPFLLCASAP
jgi:hypothetical protein